MGEKRPIFGHDFRPNFHRLDCSVARDALNAALSPADHTSALSRKQTFKLVAK
jgi:hypothetical protein